jgi:ABC-type nickel/cobalt efflux system permease component RcnA
MSWRGFTIVAGLLAASVLAVLLAVPTATSAGLWTFLSFGCVLGMAHALDADHLAAVAAMVDRRDGMRSLILRGAAWGLGHTVSLFVICTCVVLLGLSISGGLEAALELAVGLMIVALGVRVLVRFRRDRIHIHVHEHDGSRHIHAHSHAGESMDHDRSPHDHGHAGARTQLATFAVGLLHGAAGSAGLLVLTVAATDSLLEAVLYFATFGIGSLVGMAALTGMASLPLSMIQRGTRWMKTATALSISGLAIWIGGSLAVHSLGGLWAGL